MDGSTAVVSGAKKYPLVRSQIVSWFMYSNILILLLQNSLYHLITSSPCSAVFSSLEEIWDWESRKRSLTSGILKRWNREASSPAKCAQIINMKHKALWYSVIVSLTIVESDSNTGVLQSQNTNIFLGAIRNLNPEFGWKIKPPWGFKRLRDLPKQYLGLTFII